MKKVLFTILIGLGATLLSVGIFIYDRYRQNPEQIFPLPYEFEQDAPALALDAPIVIIGDRMAHELGRRQDELAGEISRNLSKPIKIQTLARPGHGLHRTLHELRSLTQWPQILIYQGGSQEFLETKFHPEEIRKIKKNFDLYRDDRIETLLILYPALSRIVYHPVKRVRIPADPGPEPASTPADYVRRLDTELLLYEQQLIHLAQMAKDRNSLLILTTTPVNPEVPPRKVCEFSTNLEIEKELLEIQHLLEQKNLKSAFAKSSKLVKQRLGNARLHFLHGQASLLLGKSDEARESLLEASSYDCVPWRATEVQNSIIRRVARSHQVLLFDFSRLVEKDWDQGSLFSDEVFPQNLYYERATKQLGIVIRSILKL